LRRDDVEPLRAVFADHMHRVAAARAGGIFRFDRNALPRQDLGLAVERAVVGIFGDDDMGNQLLGRQATLDQPRWRRRLHDCLLAGLRPYRMAWAIACTAIHRGAVASTPRRC